MGHLNYNSVRVLKSKGLIPVRGPTVEKFCEPCVYGKQSKNPVYSSDSRTSYPIELVHTDVCQVNNLSYNGRKYFVTFLDDFSNFSFVYPISYKSEVLSKFKEYHTLVTNKFNRGISRLRCDSGTEYLNENFRDFCQMNGVQ